MLELPTIRDELLRISREHLGRDQVKDVLVEEDDDVFGKSLRITIVLNARKKTSLSGESLGRISIEALEFLVRNADERYPYTHYATDRELAALKAK